MRIYTFLRKGGTVEIVAESLLKARQRLATRGLPATLIYVTSRPQA